MLNIPEDDESFDNDVLIHINSVFAVLTQLGVGPERGFYIEDADATWDEFINTDKNIQLNAVKTYIYLKVKLLFDPPLSSAVIESTNRMIDELEWRLNAAVE